MNPDKFTNQEIYIEVSDQHELYVHDWGNKASKNPILFLHGGPGSGSSDRYKNGFNPDIQRVIFFDQRGSGKSLPKGSLVNNTTSDLVEDIEKIIKKLKLEKVIITGGSWGSTLALAYAIKNPSYVHALVLDGIYTARKSETEHLDNGGFRSYFPDLWEKYTQSVPSKFKDDPSSYHYENIFGDDKEKVKKSAYAYSELLEGPLLSLDDRYTPEKYEKFDPDAMNVEMHYLKNNCFMPENYIFDNADKITMPVYLIQGRYDMVCPPVTAYELNKLLPNSQIIWTLSGHRLEREAASVKRTILSMLTC